MQSYNKLLLLDCKSFIDFKEIFYRVDGAKLANQTWFYQVTGRGSLSLSLSPMVVVDKKDWGTQAITNLIDLSNQIRKYLTLGHLKQLDGVPLWGW